MHIWVIEAYINGEFRASDQVCACWTRKGAIETKRMLDRIASGDGPYRIRKYVREEV